MALPCATSGVVKRSGTLFDEARKPASGLKATGRSACATGSRGGTAQWAGPATREAGGAGERLDGHEADVAFGVAEEDVPAPGGEGGEGGANSSQLVACRRGGRRRPRRRGDGLARRVKSPSPRRSRSGRRRRPGRTRFHGSRRSGRTTGGRRWSRAGWRRVASRA